MQIKLDLKGELLEVLKKISEQECRSCTQQVMFILKNHLKDEINSLKCSDNDIKSPIGTITNYKEPTGTISKNEEQSVQKDTEYIPEIVPKTEVVDIPEIDDDILNF